MKYALDASVAAKWVLPEPDSSKAVALRDDFRQAVHELLAPDTFPAEIAHAPRCAFSFRSFSFLPRAIVPVPKEPTNGSGQLPAS